MSRVRMAVVGCGYMGSLHAQKIAALAAEGEPVELAGVADIVESRARLLAERWSTRAECDFRQLLNRCDAAIVAVPTLAHGEVGRELLGAGCDVLIEKPLAATTEEASELLQIAHNCGRILQVGHLEWFNSAIRVVRERIQAPRFVEVHRLAPFPDRSTDIDVVRDLMIHDLDILQQVLGEEPAQIEAVGVPVLTDSADIASARITYPGGCLANLTASRVSPSPVRRLRFFQRDGYFSVDLLEQSAVVFRREPNSNGGRPEIQMEKLKVDRGDALLEQLRAFVRCVRNGTPPAVNGASGLGALRTALRVNAAMAAAKGWE